MGGLQQRDTKLRKQVQEAWEALQNVTTEHECFKVRALLVCTHRGAQAHAHVRTQPHMRASTHTHTHTHTHTQALHEREQSAAPERIEKMIELVQQQQERETMLQQRYKSLTEQRTELLESLKA